MIQSCFRSGLVEFEDTQRVVHFAHPSLLLQDRPSSLKFALHVLLISSAHFLDFLFRVSQIGFHEEFPNSNEFCNHLPSFPTRSLFIKSTLNPSIFCYFPFCSYLGQSASRTCVERFVTRSGRIPPAFRITFRTLVSCFPGLNLLRSLLGSWLLSKPYSPSSSTLSPRLLMHALSSTFNVTFKQAVRNSTV